MLNIVLEKLRDLQRVTIAYERGAEYKVWEEIRSRMPHAPLAMDIRPLSIDFEVPAALNLHLSPDVKSVPWDDSTSSEEAESSLERSVVREQISKTNSDVFLHRYYDTMLLNDPLGLENMHIMRPRSGSPTPESTPWVWTPRELTPEPPISELERLVSKTNRSGHCTDSEPGGSADFESTSSTSTQPIEPEVGHPARPQSLLERPQHTSRYQTPIIPPYDAEPSPDSSPRIPYIDRDPRTPSLRSSTPYYGSTQSQHGIEPLSLTLPSDQGSPNNLGSNVTPATVPPMDFVPVPFAASPSVPMPASYPMYPKSSTSSLLDIAHLNWLHPPAVIPAEWPDMPGDYFVPPLVLGEQYRVDESAEYSSESSRLRTPIALEETGFRHHLGWEFKPPDEVPVEPMSSSEWMTWAAGATVGTSQSEEQAVSWCLLELEELEEVAHLVTIDPKDNSVEGTL